MIILQIAFSILYGNLINVKTIQLNTGSVVITIGLALLVIAGSYEIMQDLDLCLDIRED